MLTTKYLRVLRNRKSLSIRTNTQSTASTEIQSINQGTEEKHLKQFETLTNVTKRTRVKKPNRPPFAKNLFLGKFDNAILTYPELSNEDIKQLEQDTNHLGKLLKQSHMVNCRSLSEKGFRQNLSDYKIIGLQGPQLLDAKSCSVTESFRFLEILCEHNLAQSLINHELLGVQPLVRFASDNLKKKYLHSIIKGESVAALCYMENEMDISMFKTQADLQTDDKQWVCIICKSKIFFLIYNLQILNGEKTWVFNGNLANFLLVVAKTNSKCIADVKEVKLSIFLVDKDSPGILVGNYDVARQNVSKISFKDTPVPTG